jgi:hypothetical protein
VQRGYRYWRQVGRPTIGPDTPPGTTVLEVSESRTYGQRYLEALDGGGSRLFVHREAHRRTVRT